MGVEEAESFGGKAVEVGGRDFRAGVVALEVAPTEVIGEDDNDIGGLAGEKVGWGGEGQEAEKGGEGEAEGGGG